MSRISPERARSHRRAAMLTAGPMTVYSMRRGEPILPESTLPRLSPCLMLRGAPLSWA